VVGHGIMLGSVAIRSVALRWCDRFSRGWSGVAGFCGAWDCRARGCGARGCRRHVVTATAGSSFCTRLRLCGKGLVLPVGVMANSVMAIGIAVVSVVAVSVATVGCDDVRVNLIGLAELFLRRGPHALGFRLLFAGVPAQALRLDFGLFCVGLGAGRFGLAIPRSELVGFGFFTHFGGLVPVRLHLAPPVEEEHRCDDRNHYNNADDDPHKLS
jgi:hypothetical protein